MKNLFPILILITIVGCHSEKIDAPIISLSELEVLRCKWQEPKYSQWFYIGSENGYHMLVHRDLPKDKYFRIKMSEFPIENPKIIMNDESNWDLMPWGPGSEVCEGKNST